MATVVSSLIPELQARDETLHRLRGEAGARLVGLTDAQLVWTPERGRWSAAQVVDHLNRAGYQILPRFTEAIDSLQKQGKTASGPFRYGLPERLFMRMLSPNPPFKTPVPPGFEPPAILDSPAQEVSRFLDLQDALRDCLAQASGLDLKAARIPSPVNARLKFSLGAYLHAIIGHEEYHWLQVEALLAHPGFPAA